MRAERAEGDGEKTKSGGYAEKNNGHGLKNYRWRAMSYNQVKNPVILSEAKPKDPAGGAFKVRYGIPRLLLE